jgi:hypothetical protein
MADILPDARCRRRRADQPFQCANGVAQNAFPITFGDRLRPPGPYEPNLAGVGLADRLNHLPSGLSGGQQPVRMLRGTPLAISPGGRIWP